MVTTRTPGQHARSAAAAVHAIPDAPPSGSSASDGLDGAAVVEPRSNPVVGFPDHAGMALARIVAGHVDVVKIELLGQLSVPGAETTYSLGVVLADGRELFVDVQDG